MTKQNTTNNPTALSEKEFEFFANFALGGIHDPNATKEDKKLFSDIGRRQITVADAFNLSMLASNTMVNQGMSQLAQIVSPALDAPNVLGLALINKGILTQKDLEEAEEKFNEQVAEQEEELRKVAQQQQAQEEDELTLEPKMTVVRNESDVDLSVKGK